MNFHTHKTPTTDPIIAITQYDVQCAWCLKKAGLPMGNGSHGICPTCEQEQYQLFQLARAERNARKGR